LASTKAELFRRLPVGAEVTSSGAHFRVWAPDRVGVDAVFEDGEAVKLAAEGRGYFSGSAAGRRAGDRYRLRLDGGELLPDPASRFQPEGPHGPSQLVDPDAFRWTDAAWSGRELKGQVFYELHVGCFSREGTWAGAARRLPELAELGVTTVEVMPAADWPGRFNWGYDGVCLFSPARAYGGPDDFRAFVDRAHALGLGVVLDVVYNHLGPDGNYLGRFARAYFSSRHRTDWGEAINYDGPDCGPVREFMIANAVHWISEYHLDGLRLDATQSIYDDSAVPLLRELGRAARAAAKRRRIVIVAENEPQDSSLLAAPESGGCGLDAMWNDDFHHSMRAALTGRREAYFLDYTGSAQELISSLKSGFLYQGQRCAWQKQARGASTRGIAAEAFVCYLENHDQIANSTPAGRRLSEQTSPGRLRAATAALLLGPGTPLLFMGQEDGGPARFTYFADHAAGLREAVAQGRRSFMAQFASMAGPEAQAAIGDPADPAVYARCLAERSRTDAAKAWRAMHRDLLALRRGERAIAAQSADRLEGAVLGPGAFCLRFFGDAGDDRLLLVNLGDDLRLAVLPEPLLAAPSASGWTLQWTSEHPLYGGDGVVGMDEESWRLPAGSALLLRPAEEA
jgi:maltooligosyltrehalose trehalohydrolase